MKFCDNCGQKLKTEDQYCPNCGQKIGARVVIRENKEGLGTASMVIGIISLVLAFIISVGVFPLAIVGLILGIVNKADKGKKVSGIILNIIAILLSIMIFIAFLVVLMIAIPDSDSDYEIRDIPEDSHKEEVVGVWNCKNVKDLEKKDYELTLTVNNDDTFIVASYETPKDYVEGTYDFEVNNIIRSYKFYSLELEGQKEYKNGDYKGVNNIEYKMVITKIDKEVHAVLNNDDQEKTYYCTK